MLSAPVTHRYVSQSHNMFHNMFDKMFDKMFDALHEDGSDSRERRHYLLFWRRAKARERGFAQF